MGNTYALRGRMAPAITLTLLAVVAVVAMLAFAGQASAFSGYKHGTAQSCASCHPGGDTNTPPTNADCQTCHTGFTTAHTVGGTASTCWTCHTPGESMTTAKTNAAVGGCGAASSVAGCHNNTGHAGSKPTTCVNCHGVTATSTDPATSAHHKTAVTDVTVGALVTIKSSASKLKLGKKVTLSGLAKSVQDGYVVKVKVQKKGKTWKTLTNKTAVWTKATSSWKLVYKPGKKGSYRFKASTPLVAGTNGNLVAIAAKTTGYKYLTVK